MVGTLIAAISCIVTVIAYRKSMGKNKRMFGWWSKVPYTLHIREDMYLRRPKCIYSLLTVIADLMCLYVLHEYIVPFVNLSMYGIYALVYSILVTVALLVFIAIVVVIVFDSNTYAYERGLKKYLAIYCITGVYTVSALVCICEENVLLKELYTVIATAISGSIVICLVLKAITFMPKAIMSYKFGKNEDVAMILNLEDGAILHINLLKESMALLSNNSILIMRSGEYEEYCPEDISSVEVGSVKVIYNGVRWVK